MKAFIDTNGGWEFDGTPQELAELKRLFDVVAVGESVSISAGDEESNAANADSVCDKCAHCNHTIDGNECMAHGGVVCYTSRALNKFCGPLAKSFTPRGETK